MTELVKEMYHCSLLPQLLGLLRLVSESEVGY